MTKKKTGNTTNKEGKKTTQTRKKHKAEILELVLKIKILKVEIHKLGQQKEVVGVKN